MKDLTMLAVENKLIDAGQAFLILAEKDKEKNAENKKVLISSLTDAGLMGGDKTEKPTADDYAEALKKVLDGKGQNDF
jgi:hypothetical protein